LFKFANTVIIEGLFGSMNKDWIHSIGFTVKAMDSLPSGWSGQTQREWQKHFHQNAKGISIGRNIVARPYYYCK